ncbi:MAG: addiction module protein [Candidatus Sabulitectum sp.]|nr:addiction module protein [Candidatus Sabulitectum sp.]
MRMTEIIESIDGMELSRKLMLVEDIWDSIARNNCQLPLPEWQKAELNQRYSEYNNGDIKLHDCKSVHEKIRNNYSLISVTQIGQ